MLSFKDQFLSLLYICRVIKSWATRAMMQRGRSVKATNSLPLREVSSAVTMIALVVIYTAVNVPEICLWAGEGFISTLSPSSNLVTVFFNAGHIVQVCMFWTVYFLNCIVLTHMYTVHLSLPSNSGAGIQRNSHVLQLCDLSVACQGVSLWPPSSFYLPSTVSFFLYIGKSNLQRISLNNKQIYNHNSF